MLLNRPKQVPCSGERLCYENAATTANRLDTGAERACLLSIADCVSCELLVARRKLKVVCCLLFLIDRDLSSVERETNKLNFSSNFN